MSFTDQKPHIATEKDCNKHWGGKPDGRRFRCFLCGYKFVPGDVYRWVYSSKYLNPLVCTKCDGEDVLERWHAMCEEVKTRFWWLLDE